MNPIYAKALPVLDALLSSLEGMEGAVATTLRNEALWIKGEIRNQRLQAPFRSPTALAMGYISADGILRSCPEVDELIRRLLRILLGFDDPAVDSFSGTDEKSGIVDL